VTRHLPPPFAAAVVGESLGGLPNPAPDRGDRGVDEELVAVAIAFESVHIYYRLTTVCDVSEPTENLAVNTFDGSASLPADARSPSESRVMDGARSYIVVSSNDDEDRIEKADTALTANGFEDRVQFKDGFELIAEIVRPIRQSKDAAC